MKAAANIHIVEKRNKAAAAASLRAAHKRSQNAAAGLLRIDGEIVIAAEKARELGIPANTLRLGVSYGIKTTAALKAWKRTGCNRQWMLTYAEGVA